MVAVLAILDLSDEILYKDFVGTTKKKAAKLSNDPHLLRKRPQDEK
jgi:hypothetical protein